MTDRLDDGFSTTIAFSAGSSGVTLQLWEKEVTPPGIAGGGPNETTTMRNTAWRTMSPKQLMTLLASSLVAAYDPAVYDEMVAMINVNQAITLTFSDNSTLVFWGWIDGFTPNNIVEGEQPTVNLNIEPSNQNAAGTEIAPAYADAP